MIDPQEQYSIDKWYVLNKIKDRDLRKSHDIIIEYTIRLNDPRIIAKSIPSANDEASIIAQLMQEGAIRQVQPSQEIKARVDEFILYPKFIYFLEILNPAFEKIYKKFSTKFNNADTKKETIEPSSQVINSIGYLKFGKNKKKTQIARENTQQFKLLSFLMDPEFGVAKTIEVVFQHITKKKQKMNTDLNDIHMRKGAMLDTIKNTIKELQKNGKLKSGDTEIVFRFDDKKTKIFLERKD